MSAMRPASWLLVTLALAGCHRDRPAWLTVSADNHELRDAFDHDTDDVRVIMLVSPS